MKINEVVKKTGLTKKAIRYYEQEGLIEPFIDDENGYRDYDDENLEKLMKIILFRQLGTSIKEIRSVFQEPRNLNQMLIVHRAKINENISLMERSRNIINLVLENNQGATPNEITSKLKILTKTIDLDNRQKSSYIAKELQRLFPGAYGKVLSVFISPFIDVPIDTKEKEKAWMEIVRYLDGISIEYSDGLQESFGNISDDFLEKSKDLLVNAVEEFVSMSEEEKYLYKQRIFEVFDKFVHDERFIYAYKKNFGKGRALRESMRQNGFYGIFIKNLYILNDKFKKYYGFIEEVEKEVELKYKKELTKALP